MEKKIERFLGFYANSLFLILTLALVFLIFAYVNAAENSGTQAYTAANITQENMSFVPILAFGCVMVVFVAVLFHMAHAKDVSKKTCAR